MMKKLAVTLFALSLTALGCGSDDGGKKDAAAPKDGLPGAEVQVQPDVPITPDVAVGPEVQRDQTIVDQAQGVEVQAAVEVRPVEAGIDGARIEAQKPIDGGTPDAPIGIDGGKLDAPPSEAGKAIDGGAVDGGSAG